MRIMRRRFNKRTFGSLCVGLAVTYTVCKLLCYYDEATRKVPTTWSQCQEVIYESPLSLSSILQDWICNCYKPPDREIYSEYVKTDCDSVRKDKFSHPSPTEEEKNFPIAYAMVLFKSADLAEKVLQAIYMPHNIYCIHVDVKSSQTFRDTIVAMTSCLDNVFLTSKPVDLIWAHVSTLHAQMNCLRDLMASSVKWKYFMHIAGQELPLYENAEIVRALTFLKGKNNIESFDIPENNWDRMLYSHKVKRVEGGEFHGKYKLERTEITKSPPPRGIQLKKGSNFVALSRKAAEYVLGDQTATELLDWLHDTESPDEAFYSSLQQHPGFPGGIHGNQSEWIMRAVRWKNENVCHGRWIRHVCWVTTRDLQWILGGENRWKIFVTKIPFDYRDDLLTCLSMARKGRIYGQQLLQTPRSGWIF